MKKVKLLDFFGDPNIGFYGISNNEITLIGKDLEKKEFQKVLKTKVFKVSANQTNLIGLFSFMNSYGIIIPYIFDEEEIKEIENIVKKFDMNLLVLKSKHTAIKNLILGNDKAAIISKYFSKKEEKKIEETLNVEVVRMDIHKFKIVGSIGYANNKGCIIHRDLKDDEIEKIEEILKVEVQRATVNFGSPFVSSGIVANDKGLVVGSRTSGPELGIISETLGIK